MHTQQLYYACDSVCVCARACYWACARVRVGTRALARARASECAFAR